MNKVTANLSLALGWTLIFIAYSAESPQYNWAKAVLCLLLVITIFWITPRYAHVIKKPASSIAKALMANNLMVVLLLDKKIFLAFQNNDNFFNMLVVGFLTVELLVFVVFFLYLKEKNIKRNPKTQEYSE